MKRLCLLILMMATTFATTAREWPGDSVFQLETTFVDQDDRAFHLSDTAAGPTLVTMFYTSCRYVCPLIIDSAKGVEHALTAEERAALQIVLISLDPARDTPAALHAIADKRKLDLKRWHLVRTEDVRTVAGVLGIRYRATNDGEFNHTSELVLIDRDGRKLARTSKLGSVPDPEFVAAVRAALAANRKPASAR